ncbi:MAG: TetR/AcrR family transcriptional regulator [bacterium]
MASDANSQRAARDRILDAADRLLVRYGYRKMTVEDIAVEAGIGKGTVYLSFPSKEEVALSCIDRMVEGLLSRLREIAEEPRSIDERLLDMLRLRVLCRLDYASRHAASLDSLLGAVRPAFLVRRAMHFRSETDIFAALLRAEARRGALRVSNAAATADALVSATNALLPFSLSARELGRRADVARRVDSVAALVIAGLRTTKDVSALKAATPARTRASAAASSRTTPSRTPRRRSPQ